MHKRYKILKGLPAYGPEAKSISVDNRPSCSEGFVVLFYKSDGTEWVANFSLGRFLGFNYVVDFQAINRMLVVAGGQGYIVDHEQEKITGYFDDSISYAAVIPNEKVIFANDHEIIVFDHTDQFWVSRRISWDGFSKLKLENNRLTGLSWDPTNSINPWEPFVIDLDTKEVIGGSYRWSEG